MGVAFNAPHVFLTDERELIQTVAAQCAQALERARLYELERAGRTAAEQSSRAKSDFLAVMSHELRTPLNAIGGYAELMELGIRGPITEEQRADLGRMRQSQRHLLGLINQVLSFAKLETGSVAFESRPVPIRDVLGVAESLVVPQANAHGLTLDTSRCPEDLEASADPEKLRQILVNLLSNAVKFTDRGGRIEVVCRGEGALCVVEVSDTGIGIPEDKLAAVFDPYFQVDRRLARPTVGTGLGLAISRDLARAMGGELTVESELGVGSTFTLVLPRA
jgi:signal transduction histidine kinase